MSIQPRNAAQLPEPLNRRLSQYALAAAASGVGMLALPQPAEGRVVYHPAHVVINYPGHYFLDLNTDHRPDFEFEMNYAGHAFAILAHPLKKQNRVWGSYSDASVLNASFTVGSNAQHFKKANSILVTTFTFTDTHHGQWFNEVRKYLGFKFSAKGHVHYGWARLTTHLAKQAVVTGYAYETIPNKPIITGKTKGLDVITAEPGSLGALAAGASKPNR